MITSGLCIKRYIEPETKASFEFDYSNPRDTLQYLTLILNRQQGICCSKLRTIEDCIKNLFEAIVRKEIYNADGEIIDFKSARPLINQYCTLVRSMATNYRAIDENPVYRNIQSIADKINVYCLLTENESIKTIIMVENILINYQ